MKSKLLIMGVLCAAAFTANAQTKGTNTLGFGVNIYTNKSDGSGTENKSKQNYYSIGYGHFIKDNTKIGFDLNYSNNDNGDAIFNNKTKNYGGNLNYQRYFPLLKTLYAYAGGRAAYLYGKQENTSPSQITTYKSNSYSIGAYGGITWFLSKRFALETNLLSADASYGETKQTQNTSGNQYRNKQTSFNVSSQGALNNLGFKIYLLF